jgi:superfamily II DNA/RNA helicase
VHRIGRTGRAGKSGIAITLITPREYKHLRMIERTARTIIDRKKLPSRADVLRARERNIVKDIAAIIGENRHEGYFPLVTELVNDYGVDHIAAAALCAAFGDIKGKTPDIYTSHKDLEEPTQTEVKGSRKTGVKSVSSKRQRSFRGGRKERDRRGGKTFQRRYPKTF